MPYVESGREAVCVNDRGTTVMRVLSLGCVAAALCASSGAMAQAIAAPGTEGFAVIAGANAIVAKYEGNSASYSNDLFLVRDIALGGDLFIFNNHANAVGVTFNLGLFTPGTELIFRLHVNNTGEDFFTGLASRNPDGHTHARAETNWQPNTTLVSFEDLHVPGPFDYNDLSFSFLNTTSRAVDGVPEPATWALLLVGFGMAGAGWRRRQQTQRIRLAF